MLSAPFIPFSAVFLYALMRGPRGIKWSEWLIRVALGEFFTALFVVSTLGLIWAIAMPGWLPQLAFRFARRLMLLALLPLLILAAMWLQPN